MNGSVVVLRFVREKFSVLSPTSYIFREQENPTKNLLFVMCSKNRYFGHPVQRFSCGRVVVRSCSRSFVVQQFRKEIVQSGLRSSCSP